MPFSYASPSGYDPLSPTSFHCYWKRPFGYVAQHFPSFDTEHDNRLSVSPIGSLIRFSNVALFHWCICVTVDDLCYLQVCVGGVFCQCCLCVSHVILPSAVRR